MIKLFKNLSKKEFGLLVIIIILIVGQVYLDLLLPDFMKDITTLLQSSGEMNDILIAGGKMLGCAVGSMILAVIVAVCSAKIASVFSYTTRDKVFKKVMNFSMEEVNDFSTASLITRTTNDITQVQMLISMGTQMIIKAPITAVWAILKISNVDMSFTIATSTTILILVVIIGTLLGMAVPKFKKVQKLTDNINKVAKQKLDGLSVVRAYNAEGYEENKFNKVNNEITNNSLFIGRTTAFFMPSIQAAMNILNVTIYLLGASLVSSLILAEDKMNMFSSSITFSSYAMQIILSFIMLCFIFMIYPRASVSAGRINEILNKDFSITEGDKTEGIDGLKGEVEFKNVSFKYPGAEEYVLENLNFTAKNGEVVAFIGSTGAGKSSVVNLIPRFYDVTAGEVLINGINVKEYTKNSLSSLIGYVSQKAVLFSGSVRSNVVFGDNPNNDNSDDNLAKSLEIAQAKSFVENLDEKYESRITQGGSNLSGGQKQRISISRAINRNSEILIFDDSFSALDYKTDRTLRDTLHKECGNSTRLIIGQRVGTIKDADKIIVLDDGKIVGMGKHKDLLDTCSVYKEIALSQLSEEELING